MDHSTSAAEIGTNYRAACTAQADSVRLLHACGARLAEVKASLPYGEWQLWLKEHQATLGFTIRTAQRLLGLAETTPASDLTEADAVQISRRVWGHEPELAPTAPNPFSSHYRRIEGFVEWAAQHPVAELPESELIELRPRIEALRLWVAEIDGKLKRLNLRIAS